MRVLQSACALAALAAVAHSTPSESDGPRRVIDHLVARYPRLAAVRAELEAKSPASELTFVLDQIAAQLTVAHEQATDSFTQVHKHCTDRTSAIADSLSQQRDVLRASAQTLRDVEQDRALATQGQSRAREALKHHTEALEMVHTRTEEAERLYADHAARVRAAEEHLQGSVHALHDLLAQVEVTAAAERAAAEEEAAAAAAAPTGATGMAAAATGAAAATLDALMEKQGEVVADAQNALADIMTVSMPAGDASSSAEQALAMLEVSAQRLSVVAGAGAAVGVAALAAPEVAELRSLLRLRFRSARSDEPTAEAPAPDVSAMVAPHADAPESSGNTQRLLALLSRLLRAAEAHIPVLRSEAERSQAKFQELRASLEQQRAHHERRVRHLTSVVHDETAQLAGAGEREALAREHVPRAEVHAHALEAELQQLTTACARRKAYVSAHLEAVGHELDAVSAIRRLVQAQLMQVLFESKANLDFEALAMSQPESEGRSPIELAQYEAHLHLGQAEAAHAEERRLGATGAEGFVTMQAEEANTAVLHEELARAQSIVHEVATHLRGSHLQVQQEIQKDLEAFDGLLQE